MRRYPIFVLFNDGFSPAGGSRQRRVLGRPIVVELNGIEQNDMCAQATGPVNGAFLDPLPQLTFADAERRRGFACAKRQGQRGRPRQKQGFSRRIGRIAHARFWLARSAPTHLLRWIKNGHHIARS